MQVIFLYSFLLTRSGILGLSFLKPCVSHTRTRPRNSFFQTLETVSPLWDVLTVIFHHFGVPLNDLTPIYYKFITIVPVKLICLNPSESSSTAGSLSVIEPADTPRVLGLSVHPRNHRIFSTLILSTF